MIEGEPFFQETPSGSEMTGAYNWYGANKSWADSKKYILEYLSQTKQDDLHDKIKKLSEYEISWVSGWICRLITKKSKINESSKTYLDNWLNEIKETDHA